jgi:hypothetical protein
MSSELFGGKDKIRTIIAKAIRKNKELVGMTSEDLARCVGGGKEEFSEMEQGVFPDYPKTILAIQILGIYLPNLLPLDAPNSAAKRLNAIKEICLEK